jgi:two-component system response regulator YesN
MNYAHAICLAHLASLAEVHPSHLCREFKKHIGCSPLQHVHRLRIQHAVVLLRQSKKSVKEIGFAVGFKRPEAFSKAFKRIMGRSPQRYREPADR